MSTWWDDFRTLLFKAAEQTQDIIARYLDFVKDAAIRLTRVLAALLLCFVLSIILGIQSAWLYQTVIVLMALVLIAMIVIALPLLVVSESAFAVLPAPVKESLRSWQRRGAAILFGALLMVVFIRVLRLWESPETMLTVLLIVSVLTLGGYFGWLQISDSWRRFVAVKLQMTLVVIALVSLFPGPARLVGELVGWTEENLRSSVFRITRPSPEWWEPSSVDELRFADAGTGEFLIWYYKDDEGNYRLSTSKGYDDFGRPLKRAETEPEFISIRSWQRAKDEEREAIRRAQAEELARREEEERIAAAERAAELARQEEERRIAEAEREAELAREAERKRLESYIAGRPETRVNYIVFFVDSWGRPSSEVNSIVEEILSKSGVTAAGAVFSDAFISPKGFDAVAAGKGAVDVVAMRLGEMADRLLLIRGTDEQLAPSRTVAGLHTYSMRISFSLIDASNGQKVREFIIGDVTGAGVSEASAKSTFIERFADAFAQRAGMLSDIP
jgi:hypothetical protein